MNSLKELYKIGNGPSSSHTMGPERASKLFKSKYPDADKFKVILYGSLALTGAGHLTDYIIKKTLSPINNEVIFDYKNQYIEHPNTVDFFAYKDNQEIGSMRVYSVGGGSIKIKGIDDLNSNASSNDVYPQKNMQEILNYCQDNKLQLWEYVEKYESKDIWNYLKDVWMAMQKAIEQGLNESGLLPGKIKCERKAKLIFNTKDSDETTKKTRLLSAYAYACNETNASGGTIVTAPTCGACGTLPAVLMYAKKDLQYNEQEILKALAAAGVIGNVIKTNGSISGAEAGCQAEVGSATSMAAAAWAFLKKYSTNEIINAAEIAMEHGLGLTCDPVLGYVQVPCIQRNAVAAIKAVDSAEIAHMLGNSSNLISFDEVVATMKKTGQDLQACYRETSEGGLACLDKFKKI